MSGVTLSGVTKKFGEVTVIHGVDLTVAEGEFCVFVGPSGCGKSTLLRMIAGLEETSAGQIRIGARDVTRVDPSERGVAMVFQTYALYPHMTVAENMGFGLKMTGHPKAETAAKVAEAARILKLGPLLERKPKALSGGQRQRVAIGRAIVRGPEVFLFDEPLSNLDAELRVEMRVEISRLHREIGATMIYVTHDQVEAMTLADKIVVLRAGRIEQVGAPLELYRNPGNRFVAGFIGSPAMNFVEATVTGPGQVTAAGLGGPVAAGIALPETGAKVVVGLRPQALQLTPGATHKVDVVEALGGVTYVHLTAPSGEKLVVEARGDVLPKLGSETGITFDPTEALFFQADAEGRRLR
ncbi:MAG: sn-glycerol-3-phosphate ABC transporter ATP-binding protein UgpC [Pseudorhodobacter sp.]|nr:MAG: sn-glycerol-3-phosphate ABC transporter ATP-binding protein UgpC [Pseudorhodobacter sp.]